MANKIMIACPYYNGELSKMPQEAKDKMKAEKPEMYKSIFEPVVVDPVQE